MQNKTYVMTKALEASLCYQGEVVVKYKIQYPQFASYRPTPYLVTLNAEYKYEAQAFERMVRSELYCDAVRDFDLRGDDSVPFFTYEFQRIFQATLLTGDIISLYFDTYRYTGGAHGATLREAQSWQLSRERRLQMCNLFPCGTDYQSIVKQAVINCIALKADDFFPDYPQLVEQTFHENQFFLTMRDMVVFFQQYDIAPYSTGIPTFALNLSQLGGCLPK